MPTYPVKPCRTCGEPKPPGRGRKYCDPCIDKSKPLYQQRDYLDRLARVRRGEEEPRLTAADKAPDGTKWCNRCKQYLPLVEFKARAGQKRGKGLVAYCTPCGSAYLHENRLLKVFGISGAEYDELLSIQGGRCAICHKVPRKVRLAVDHCHKTGQVRGLLCSRCNHKVLGAADESPSLLRRAALYLEQPVALTRRPVPDVA